MAALTVNGVRHEFTGDPEMPLLWFLRDVLGMTGTKYGCGIAQCGACTVHVDGVARRSCSVTVQAVDGRAVTTIEGLSATGDHPLQAAWKSVNVAQCGYCQAGQIMQAATLLAATPKPTDAQIDAALEGNLCRCGTYQRIRQAVRLASGRSA